MADSPQLRDPWLVAVWPGMGNVALAAGGYLVAKLSATLVHELSAPGVFDIKTVEVKAGVAQAGRMPRNMIFEWRAPAGGRDLLIFVGEAQPESGGFAFCRVLLDYARKHGVRRVFTFAAMATQLHPSNDPRVFGAATDADTLEDLRPLDVEILDEGQISGLNGVLLAASAEQGIPGTCLLGELPFFAVGVANPKASQAVLEIFTKLAGIDIDFSELSQQSEVVEEGLLELLEKMKEAAREQGEGEEGFVLPEFVEVDDEDASNGDGAQDPEIDDDTRRRIEAMFQEAHRDRQKAFRLKEELDRLGVFKRYEDRFLDLFRRAE
jgi:proteasome assembly chaperone (PAC2) family protein